MSKVADEIATRCELALQGKVMQVRDDSEVQVMFEYICSACSVEPSTMSGCDDVLNNRIRRYTKTNDVAYIVTNRVYGMRVIAFLLKSRAKGEDHFPDPLKHSYGVKGHKCAFTYALNLDADDSCSEFGDCFFKKEADTFWHRVS